MDTEAKKLHCAVIYHSQSGASLSLAEAVCRGIAKELSVEHTLTPALAADATHLQRSDAVIFVTPENFGTMSGGLKDFFDRTYYVLQEQALNIPYALLVSAGNDGRGAVRDVERIATGYPLKKIAEAIIIRGIPSVQDCLDCEDVGQAMAAGLSMGIY